MSWMGPGWPISGSPPRKWSENALGPYSQEVAAAFVLIYYYKVLLKVWLLYT